MFHIRPLALASLVLFAGCASDPDASTPQRADAPSPSAVEPAYDPLNGKYPQIMWMCNVYEVPSGTEIASDGTVRASASAKPNGVGVVRAADSQRAFDSVRSLPRARLLASPASFSLPEALAILKPGTRDMAGGSIGDRTLTLSGTFVDDRIRTSVEVASTRGAFSASCHCGARDVPAGGALLFLCAGADSSQPCTLLVARPTVLRSPEDFPYQRASSFSSSTAR